MVLPIRLRRSVVHLAFSRTPSRAILARWAGPLRAGIDSLVAAFDPEIVILGGGLGAGACQALAPFPALSSWFQRKIAPAELGDRAGVIGAALAALEKAS